MLGDRFDRLRARRRDGLGRTHGLGVLGRDRRRLGDLDVGRVVAREHDVVLAGCARRHVLVGASAAHHADVGFDAVPAQAAPVVDVRVRLALRRVGRIEARCIAVEGVGVLHDELAGAKHACPRTRLVALLGLQLVERERQLAVRLHDLRDVRRHRFFVGHREHHGASLTVLEREQLRDLVAARLLPELARLQHRQRDLLRAGRVHLLADDRGDLLVDPPAGRSHDHSPEPS